MIQIDGSLGEGGGQIVRTSLALSLVTGQPFTIDHIRAGRKKPGLMRQHLTAVQAAAEIGHAEVAGNHIGSPSLTFKPGKVKPGRFNFSIGSAGSCTLVLQTVLPALMQADGPSELILEGGTHNPYAPPYDFLEKTFIPLLNRMGPVITPTMERPGFYPAGGGRCQVVVLPSRQLAPLELIVRGPIRSKQARAVVANLPLSIAQRELKVLADNLGWRPEELLAVTEENAKGPGNVLIIEIRSDTLTEVITGFGQRGVSAEQVARGAIGQVREYIQHDRPVGRHLADQLLIPLAMAGKGRFITLPPTRHTQTNIEIIKRFLAVDIRLSEWADHRWEIAILR
jgi:RNA 3'-terminal phosphate cyclase (ATP)